MGLLELIAVECLLKNSEWIGCIKKGLDAGITWEVGWAEIANFFITFQFSQTLGEILFIQRKVGKKSKFQLIWFFLNSTHINSLVFLTFQHIICETLEIEKYVEY